MMGSLVKRFWAEQHGLKAEAIYHCSIMPCFDKKLEAARDDFDLPGAPLPTPRPAFFNICCSTHPRIACPVKFVLEQ